MKNTQLFVALPHKFHNLFEIPRFPRVTAAFTEIIDGRIRLIEEEEKELHAAKTNEEHLDALCDLAYVVGGTADVLGVVDSGYSSVKKRSSFAEDSAMQEIYKFTESLLCELLSIAPCQKKLTYEIHALLTAIDDAGAVFGYRLIPAFEAVHDNNMQKLWRDRPTDDSLTVKPVFGGYIVRNSKGKIIKPLDHVKINLTPYV